MMKFSTGKLLEFIKHFSFQLIYKFWKMRVFDDSDRQNFWRAIEACYRSEIYPHIKNIFKFCHLDNPTALANIFENRFQDPALDFPFARIEEDVASDRYLRQIPEGADRTLYYGDNYDECDVGYKFAIGDEMIINKIVTTVGSVCQKTKDAQDKFWSNTRELCPVQPHTLKKVKRNRRLIAEALLNRKEPTETYDGLKYNIEFTIEKNKNGEYLPSALVKCPKCIRFVRVKKYLKHRTKFCWNLSNFFTHFDRVHDEVKINKLQEDRIAKMNIRKNRRRITKRRGSANKCGKDKKKNTKTNEKISLDITQEDDSSDKQSVSSRTLSPTKTEASFNDSVKTPKLANEFPSELHTSNLADLQESVNPKSCTRDSCTAPSRSSQTPSQTPSNLSNSSYNNDKEIQDILNNQIVIENNTSFFIPRFGNLPWQGNDNDADSSNNKDLNDGK